MKKSRKLPSLVVYSSLKDSTFTAVRRGYHLTVNRWLTKGVYYRVRGWALGWSFPAYRKTSLCAHLGLRGLQIEEMSQGKIEGSRLLAVPRGCPAGEHVTCEWTRLKRRRRFPLLSSSVLHIPTKPWPKRGLVAVKERRCGMRVEWEGFSTRKKLELWIPAVWTTRINLLTEFNRWSPLPLALWSYFFLQQITIEDPSRERTYTFYGPRDVYPQDDPLVLQAS